MSGKHAFSKVMVVARTEYLIAITSKAFLIGIVMMPIFMGGAILVQYLTRDQVDLTERKIAIVDRTQKLLEPIAQQAEIRNTQGIFAGTGSERKQTAAKFIIEPYSEPFNESAEPETRTDAVLSEQVRSGDLFAFAIIEEDAFQINSSAVIRYYSQSPSYQTMANWLRDVVDSEIKRQRIADLQLSSESVAAISQSIPIKQFGLVEQAQDGSISDAKEENRLLTFAVPFAGLMLMFMMIMSVAPAMLNNVLEEKMQKISEFLISSITPFQLMLGKLVGAVAVGLTLSAVYLGAVYGLAVYYEASDVVPIAIYAWFVFFLFIALIIFGSIFSAIGAACSEIRDAQSLMTPVMLLVIIPVMCMAPILDSPNSLFSKLISLFPPATPMLMFLRIAVPPGPEPWEIALGTVLSVLFAMVCVWAAGKVFRIGILSQGQAPTFAKLIGWIVTK
jgi:ABC-2 type transport system permease protein